MTGEPTNPYAAPATISQASPEEGVFEPGIRKKAEAIIKDANQFGLAILLCFFCSGIGFVLIVPWYVGRLIQWHLLARTEPQLLQRNAPKGGLAQRFQSARMKIIIGLVVASAIVGGIILFIIMKNSRV